MVNFAELDVKVRLLVAACRWRSPRQRRDVERYVVLRW
jgi:hypothetical protein